MSLNAKELASERNKARYAADAAGISAAHAHAQRCQRVQVARVVEYLRAASGREGSLQALHGATEGRELHEAQLRLHDAVRQAVLDLDVAGALEAQGVSGRRTGLVIKRAAVVLATAPYPGHLFLQERAKARADIQAIADAAAQEEADVAREEARERRRQMDRERHRGYAAQRRELRGHEGRKPRSDKGVPRGPRRKKNPEQRTVASPSSPSGRIAAA